MNLRFDPAASPRLCNPSFCLEWGRERQSRDRRQQKTPLTQRTLWRFAHEDQSWISRSSISCPHRRVCHKRPGRFHKQCRSDKLLQRRLRRRNIEQCLNLRPGWTGAKQWQYWNRDYFCRPYCKLRWSKSRIDHDDQFHSDCAQFGRCCEQPPEHLLRQFWGLRCHYYLREFRWRDGSLHARCQSDHSRLQQCHLHQ